jgi:pantothenate kinase type III
MNLLTLDLGNTHAHAALFRSSKLIESGLASDVSSWIKKHGLTMGDVQAVMSRVKKLSRNFRPSHPRGTVN